jgi:hypothetical protein
MKFAYLFFVIVAVVGLSVPAIAQEGHPLTGTWYGDFGMTTAKRNDLTVVLKWDGANTTGIVNPGPSAVPIKTAKLDVKLGNPGSGGRGGGGGGGGNRGGNAGAPAEAQAPPTPPTPPTFNVHFEVDAKNKAGGMDHFVFDGKIENPVAGNRTMVGTWTCGTTKGDFRLRRL